MQVSQLSLDYWGTDGYTRSTKELFAKAKELTQKGVHTYILTGSYAYPSNTLTSSVEDDIVFIDSILGVKLALSDHRSSHITEDELIHLASRITCQMSLYSWKTSKFNNSYG